MSAVIPGNTVSAADRLQLSRESLREAMQADAQAKTARDGPSHTKFWSSWANTLRKTPGISLLMDAAGAWWSQHPARTATLLASEAAKTLVQPLAKRNPVGLVLGAAAFGALFAWSRPWRWIMTPALFAGLLPQIVSKVIAQVPPKNWMSIIAAMAAESGAEPRTEPRVDAKK